MELHQVSNTVCLSPMRKKYETESKFIDFPCGRCVNCRRRRASHWSFRLIMEERRATSSFFVTLTYDTGSVPLTKKGFMSLNKKDFQNYMKRLRKLSSNKLTYYAVGEYGSKTLRPHYHIILFNAEAKHIEQAWTLDGKKLGDIHLGTVSGASIGYTLKYICKDKQIPKFLGDDRQPEFSLMSKGIGDNYLTDSVKKWHEADMNGRLYVNLPQGQKVSMPRYYKDKIYTKAEQERINLYLQDKRNAEDLKLSDIEQLQRAEYIILKTLHEQKKNAKHDDNLT